MRTTARARTPLWLTPPQHWPEVRSLRFDPTLKTAAELVQSDCAAEIETSAPGALVIPLQACG